MEQDGIEKRMAALRQTLAAVRGVGRIVAGEGDRAGLMQKVCDCLTATRGYTDVRIVTYSPAAGDFSTVPAALEKIRAVEEAIRNGGFDLYAGEPFDVAQSRVTPDDRPPTERNAVHPPICAPLERRGRLFGLLIAVPPPDAQPDEEERALLAEFAALLARALDAADDTRDESFATLAEKYRDVFDTAIDGLAFVRMDGVIEDANPTFLDMLGYTLSEIRAKTYREITPAKWAESEKAIIDGQVLRRGYSDEYEKEYVRRDGTIFPVTVRVWLVRDAAGRPRRMLGLVRDATRQRQAEDAIATLVKSTVGKIGREFFDAVTQNVCKWLDADLAILGTIRQGDAVRSLSFFVDGHHADPIEYHLYCTPCQTAVERGFVHYPEGVARLFPEDEDLARLGANGYIGAVIGDFTGNPLGVLCVLSRKRMELPPSARAVLEIIVARAAGELERFRIQDEQNRLYGAIEQSGEVFVITDTEAKILYVNAAFEKITGYAAAEALGRNPRILQSGEHTKEFYREMWETLCAKRVWKGTLINRRKDGARYVEEATISPVIDTHGEITHFVAVKRDVTRRIEMEQALEKSRQRAEAANRAKSAFLTGVSHELRTPLNAIIGFSRLLERNRDMDEKAREYLKIVSDAGNHLLNLINDILDMAKVEAGKMSLELSSFLPGPVLASCLEVLRHRAIAKNLTLSCEAGDLGVIVADQQKFRQIVYNLLSNACKFTGHDGRVGIRAARTQDELRVTVFDTGIGIAPERQAELFGEFHQIDVAHSKKYPGTGLGLALSKKFVELHGGRIWVESRTGHGSRFNFTLPINATRANPTHAPVAIDTGAKIDSIEYIIPATPTVKDIPDEKLPEN